ncbi:hypothetical protein BJ546DRAFT_1036637 [Cryomyces antarcticus]
MRSRRDPKSIDNGSTNSVASTDTADDRSSGGLAASVDGVFDRIKKKAQAAVRERRGSAESDNRLSSLMSGNRRKKNKNAEGDDGQHAEELRRGRRSTQLEKGPLQVGGDIVPVNPSEENLDSNRSEGSSLLTEESDQEAPTRPTISPHASHLGYLTLSSPLIASQTIDPTKSISPTVATDPATSSTSTPSLDGILASETTRDLGAPSSRNRSRSPAGRLKEAFTINRKPTNKQVAADNESVVSVGSEGGDLGGLSGARSNRRASLSSRLSKALESTGRPAHSAKAPSEEHPSTPQASSTTKSINTSLPATPPNLVEAPTTLVTPPTPTDSHSILADLRSPNRRPSDASSHKPSFSTSDVTTSPTVNTISHRRARSAVNPPSRLSNATSAPLLTPTVEETKTPGGSLTSPGVSGGFFSSVFSAAQNAANQLSNTIANTNIAPNQRSKSGTLTGDSYRGSQVDGEPATDPSREDNASIEEPEGDLSLSHLGISDASADPSPMTSKVELSGGLSNASSTIAHDEAVARAEDKEAARAVSVAYSDKPAASAMSNAAGARPMSLNGLAGDQTPPRTATNDLDGPNIKRSGSVRSRISRSRRHRGSSATLGTTIGAAVGASTTNLTHSGAQINGSGHRLTGFAVASSKRNKDFHQLFRSVPEDDYLIEDYSAALQRDILLHGRIYISEGHICFSSNILGWVTNLVISFDEVVSIEKKSTAVIFPNAIVIQTLHARNIFASLVSRDSTYDLLVGIWKISHPNLKSSVNGVTLDDAGTGDKTEKADLIEEEDGSVDGSDDDDVYDEDAEEEDDMGSYTEPGNGSIAGSDIGDGAKALSRKPSATAVGAPGSNGIPTQGLEKADAVVTGAAVSADFPGPPMHAPTECSDQDSHYDKLLTDTLIPAPLGKVYSMMFGPASGAFVRKWLVEDQKSTDLQLEDDKKGLGDDTRTLSYSFIKPLNAPIGPKQTKCIVTCNLEAFDLEKAVTVLCSTQTPDVPSGNIFTTKTKYCLMWGSGNSTRLIMTCTVEWTGKSWLKGPIEKGANDGQTLYAKDIVAALRAAVTTKPPVRGTVRGKGGKGKRRREAFDTAGTEAGRATDAAKDARTQQEDKSWGVLEPLHGIFGPIVDVVGSVITAPVIFGIFCILLAWMWFRQPTTTSGTGSVGFSGLGTPQRIAAYEEIWRREESELWDWLEERVGLEDVQAGGFDGKKKAKTVKTFEGMLESERMSERQIDDAIRVTEERLGALKEAVEKRKVRKRGTKQP